MEQATKNRFGIYRFIDRIIPAEYVLPFLAVLAFNLIGYFLVNLIASRMEMRMFDFAIDRNTPLIPWMVYIYVGAFPYWFVSIGALFRSTDRETAYRLITAYFFSLLIGYVCFLLFPLTIRRPEAEAGGLTGFLLETVYNADQPTCLLPSLHCSFSYISFRAVCLRKGTPAVWKILSCVFMILIFASTVLIKQHYFIDVVFGVAEGVLILLVCRKTQIYRIFEAPFTALNRKLGILSKEDAVSAERSLS